MLELQTSTEKDDQSWAEEVLLSDANKCKCKRSRKHQEIQEVNKEEPNPFPVSSHSIFYCRLLADFNSHLSGKALLWAAEF